MTAPDPKSDRHRRARLAAVAREGLVRWGFDSAHITRVAESFNTIYRVTSPSGHFALRVGPPERIHPPGAHEFEATVLGVLADHGLPVARVLSTLDGHASARLDSATDFGERNAMVLEWTDGRRIARPVSVETARQFGHLAARLHAVLREVGVPDLPGALDGRRVLLFDAPDRLDELVSPYGTMFRDAAHRAQAVIDALWAESGSVPMIVHGDLGPSNVVRSSGGALIPIDFQDVFIGLLEQDLAISLASLERMDPQGTLRSAFKSGYSSVGRWSLTDAAVERDLIAGRRLVFVNLALNLRRPGWEALVERHAFAVKTWMQST